MAFDPSKLLLIGPLSTRRTLPPQMARSLEQYAPQLGAVIWAWSYCHSAFHRLFVEMFSSKDRELANATWHSMHASSAQLNTLAEVAKAALADNKNLLNGILWAKNTADSLVTLRNDAAHMATVFTASKASSTVVVDETGTSPKRTKRLQVEDLQKFWFKLTGDLIALAGYVSILTVELRSPERQALPRRPKMQAIQRKATKKARGKKKSKRRNPPQSRRA